MDGERTAQFNFDRQRDRWTVPRAHTHTHTYAYGNVGTGRQTDRQEDTDRSLEEGGRAALSAMHLPPQNQSRWSPLPCPRPPTRPHTHSFLGGHRVNQRHRRTDRHLAPVGAEIRLDTSPDLEIPSGPPRKLRKPAVTVPARHNRAVALGL